MFVFRCECLSGFCFWFDFVPFWGCWLVWFSFGFVGLMGLLDLSFFLFLGRQCNRSKVEAFREGRCSLNLIPPHLMAIVSKREVALYQTVLAHGFFMEIF